MKADIQPGYASANKQTQRGVKTMPTVNLSRDEQKILLDAMHLKLWEMARQGASAAQMKAFADRMSEIEKQAGQC